MTKFHRNNIALAMMSFLFALCGVTISAQRTTTVWEKATPPIDFLAPAAYSLVNGFTTCTANTLVSNITTTGYPFGGGAVKNNLIVIVVSNTGAATRSVSAPNGMITALNDTTVDSRPSQSLFYKVAAAGDGSGASGLQIHFGAPTKSCYSFYEYSGTSWNSPLHGVANASALFGQTLITGTASPFTVGDLLVAGFFNTNNVSWTSSFSGATNGFQDQTFGGVTGGGSTGPSYTTAAFSHFLPSCATASTSLQHGNGPGQGWRGQIASFLPKTNTAPASTGTNQTVTAGNGRVTFPNVTSPGTLTVDSIDPTSPSLGPAPTGITYSSTSPAYNISTTAIFSGTLNVCITASQVTDIFAFNRLRMLHSEGGVLVDRFVSRDFNTKQVCGNMTSLSPFVLGNGLGPSAATVSISGRAMTKDGYGIRNAVIRLTDQSGNSRTAITSSFGHFRFEGVESGETYVLNVSSKRYFFVPRVLNVIDNITDVDLIAE